MRIIVLLLALLLSQFSLAQGASKWVETPHLKVRLLSTYETLSPNVQEFFLALEFQMRPEWHIYWSNPGDSGEAPSLKWSLPDNILVSDILWPPPQRIPLGPLANYGYEEKILLPIKITNQSDLTESSSFLIRLQASWLVCKIECVPEEGSFEITLPVHPETEKLSSWYETITQSLEALPIQAPFIKATHSSKEDSLVLQLNFKDLEKLDLNSSKVEIFPLQTGLTEAGILPELSLNQSTLTTQFKLTPQSLEIPKDLKFLLKIQKPDSSTEAYELASTFGALIRENTTGKSLWLWLFFAFLGGLLLNLMPCVLPVLSLKVFSLVQGKNQKEKTTESLGFTLGILVSFWALGGLLLLLRSGGESIGWGFQLQSPAFVSAMILLFVLISFNFLGLFEVGESLQNLTGRVKVDSQKGFSSSFASGILSTLIATPCTAPFMGSALGAALILPAYQAMLLFTLLGLGLATPLVLISHIPKLSRILPKPGEWMLKFKVFMAFPMLGTALWLTWVLGLQLGVGAMLRILAVALTLAMGLWILNNFKHKRKFYFAIPTFVFSLYVALPLFQASTHEQSSSQNAGDYYGLETAIYSPEKLQEELSADRQIYVDFTAAWCLTCQVNKRVVFSDKKVQDFFKDKNILILVGDWTNRNAEIAKELEKHGRSGVPLNLVFKNSSGEATVLPALLNPSIVMNAFE